MLYRTEGRAWPASTPKTLAKFKVARLAGVEWEHNHLRRASSYDWSYHSPVANGDWKNLRKWAKQWRGGIHQDGSCGLESVTAPLAGDHIAKCLTDLGTALHKDKATMDHNCSVHVHVDVHDFTWKDMYRLLWVYSKIEAVLFVLGGNKRKLNHYCRPCGNDYGYALKNYFNKKANEISARSDVLDVAYDSSEGADFYKGDVDRHEEGRYRALNLCPWLWARKTRRKRGATVEFRLHENTDDTERVVEWTKLLVSLVDWVHKASDRKIKQLPTDPWSILFTVAPASKKWILKQRNFKSKKIRPINIIDEAIRRADLSH